MNYDAGILINLSNVQASFIPLFGALYLNLRSEAYIRFNWRGKR